MPSATRIVPVRHLVSGLAAAWGALIVSRPIAENDVFWHLMLGRAVERAGSRVVPEPSGLPSLASPVSVPEWLWDVLAWRSWSMGGAAVLTLFVMLCAALAGWAFAQVAFDETRGRHPVAAATLTGLALAAASVRFRERPETLALAFAALSLWAGRHAVRSRAPGAHVAVVLIALLWAQVHGTFVLAVPLFAVNLLSHHPSARHTSLLTGGLLGLALLTGPHGFAVVDFVGRHLAGDAVRHLIDMAAPTWSDLDPSRPPFHAIALLLAALALVPAAFGVRRWRSLAFAALALGLGLTSVRAVSLSALLLLPQAAVVVRALSGHLKTRVLQVSLAVALVLVGVVTWRFATRVGPLLAFSVKDSELPAEGLQALSSLPKGTTVWTSYNVGAAVGLLSDGALRVTIDSRTPLHFGDVEFAVSRDCRARLPCFKRAVEALQVGAAVVERGDECAMVATHPDFVPVAVNARYATFARRTFGVPPLQRIDVCAPNYLSASACDESFEQELTRLESAGADFLGFLRFARQLQCTGTTDAGQLSVLLARKPHWPVLRATTGLAQLRAREPALAVETLLPLVDAAYAPALPTLHEALSALAPAERRAPLERIVRVLDDATPAPFHALRATTAAELDDVEVARFEAVRAAAAGERSVLPLLRALAATAGTPEEQQVFLGWAATLEK